MAKYGTEKVFGGTSYSRDTDPIVSGKANSLGLYPWSAFRAALGTGTATSFSLLASVAKTDTVDILLFTSDVLAQGSIVASDVILTAALRPVASVPFFDATAGGADLVVPVGKVGQGYVATGEAAPNNYIECSGFPVSGVTATAQSGLIEAAILANSANISSPVSRQDWATASADSGALPVILDYTDYTVAIRDAGNKIVTAGGIVYQVVGLYKITAD